MPGQGTRGFFSIEVLPLVSRIGGRPDPMVECFGEDGAIFWSARPIPAHLTAPPSVFELREACVVACTRCEGKVQVGY